SVQQLAQVAQVVPQFLRRNSGILPSRPCQVFTGNDSRCTQCRLSHQPYQMFLFWIIKDPHRRGTILLFETFHQPVCLTICLLLALSAKFYYEPALSFREQCHFVRMQSLFSHVVDQPIIKAFQSYWMVLQKLWDLIASYVDIPITKHNESSYWGTLHQACSSFQSQRAGRFAANKRACDIKSIFWKEFIEVI